MRTISRRKIGIIAGLAVVAAIVIAVFIAERRQGDHAGHAHAAGEQGSIYYCPMHPTVTSDKQGSCPICGMKLVKRSGSQASDVAAQLARSGDIGGSVSSIALSPAQRVTANVRTTRVATGLSASELVTTGRVTFDERRVAQVTSYTAGRIEQLFANFTGDSVRRGEVVATIYSPDLYTTQQEYLLALRNRDRMSGTGFAQARSAADDLVASSRRRLQLLGMTDAQIRRLASSGRAMATTSIVAPVSGIVTQKLVVPQQYVTAGQPLVAVADLSTVWVEADVFEQDLSRVAVGQRVTVTSPSLPGVELPGTVAFIQPVVGAESRATRVRIELPNTNLQLKPDMYVTVRLSGGNARSAIVVPATAVIDRGQQQFVWVETAPGQYAPRRVTVGTQSGAQVEILSGLAAGETIVLEGGFLLDSEAQLRSAGGGE